MNRPGLGLLPPDGRHDAALAVYYKPMCAASDAEIPDEVDPSGVLSVNHQGPRNSCCGNAVDKALEGDHYDTTGEVVNYSSRFSYLAARTIDGTNDGPDAGAMIESGALGALKMGRVFEHEFRYWRDDEEFDPDIPEPIRLLGLQNCAKSIAPMKSMDDIIRFLGTRQGKIIYGMWWTDGVANYRSDQPIRNSFGGGSSLGGHALAIMGYKTIAGEKWPLTFNSHGTDWGNRGTMLVHPDVQWNAIRAAPWGAWGITLGSTFTKKPFPGFGGINA